MLVLTRRNDEKIVFPSLGVTVHVLRVRGNIVKIGVDAPAEIPVLRHEVAEDPSRQTNRPTPDAQVYSRELKHLLLNQLNSATLAIHGSQQLSAVGRGEEAEKALQTALEKLQLLSSELSNFGQKSGAARPAQRATAAAATVANPPSRCQTLLVEDDRNESELLAGYLRLSGIGVDTADDGEEALEYLASHASPDFVLLDMQMPRMDGRETIERIRRDPQLKSLRVLAISGTSPEEIGVAVGPNGIDRWFGKPLNPAKLVELMQRDIAI